MDAPGEDRGRVRKASSHRGRFGRTRSGSLGGSLAAQRWVGLMILAIVFIVFGVLFFAASAQTRVQTTSFNLLPGPTYCTIHHFDLAAPGSVTVTFSASPGTVKQYVMTAAQEQAFFAGSGLADLGSDEATTDTFTTALPSGGTYYVVSCHGTGYETTTQTGTHTMTISGLDPAPLYLGIGAVIIGLVFVLLGLRSRSRARLAPPAYASSPPPYTPAYPPSYPPSTGGTGFPSSYAPPAGIPTLRTLHVHFENASAADETLQLLLNGAPLASVPVGAGKSADLDLHPNVALPPGGAMTVEAVSGTGQRATQAVLPDAEGRASVALRLG